MQITVKTLTGRKQPFDFDPSQTVRPPRPRCADRRPLAASTSSTSRLPPPAATSPLPRAPDPADKGGAARKGGHRRQANPPHPLWQAAVRALPLRAHAAAKLAAHAAGRPSSPLPAGTTQTPSRRARSRRAPPCTWCSRCAAARSSWSTVLSFLAHLLLSSPRASYNYYSLYVFIEKC